MTDEERRAAYMDVAYLASCAVNGRVPDAERVAGMNLAALYKVAERHLLTAITAMALESAGVRDESFVQAKGKAIRKVVAFDIERAAVLAKLEEAGIWYLPLKGCVLKDLYPKLGMRQMSDNDILVDGGRLADVAQIMKELGFTQEEGGGVHDVYYKEPVCNFEMHRALMPPTFPVFCEYYKDVKTRLVKDEGNAFGYHFTDEDFYVYIVAHEYKHYAAGGTGLRSLLDTYVYCMRKGDALNWDYIAGQLDVLGIAEFERRNRELAQRLFDGYDLTLQDQEMLDYMLSSGTYGTIDNNVKNKVHGYGDGPLGKARYLLSRIIIPMDDVRASFPTFSKYPVLLPLLPFYRVSRGLIQDKRRDKMKAELHTLKELK